MTSANPSLPEPDAHIHFSLPADATQPQLALFTFMAAMAAVAVQPASSQDLLWVAGPSSLTSLTRHSWQGYVRLSDMHPFGYTPSGFPPLSSP